jgi:hypothetical protein
MPDFGAAGRMVGVAAGLGVTSRVAVGTICCGDTGLGDGNNVGVGIGVAAGLQLANSTIANRLPNRKISFR